MASEGGERRRALGFSALSIGGESRNKIERLEVEDLDNFKAKIWTCKNLRRKYHFINVKQCS